MRLIKKICLVLLLSLPTIMMAQQTEDDIVLKAMKDELDQNMAELKSPDLEKPFFMMYGITNQTSHVISASLGAIYESDQSHQRFKSSTRLLVGDYSFNDESLDDDIFSGSTPLELNLPIEDDYWGIRRSFWASTDNVYRSAARHFNQHKMTIKESDKTLEELPHRTFGKGKPVKLVSTAPASTFNHKAWENRLRLLSGIFLKYPDIEYSIMRLSFTENHRYLINSEGVVSKIPASFISLYCIAQTRNSDGEIIFEVLKQEALTEDKFPTEAELVKEVEALIQKLHSKVTTQKLDEEYYGPLLLVGNSVATTFNRILFTGKESLIANDALAKTNSFVGNSEVDYMNDKIGKKILNESITIVAKPKLKTYNGVDLYGTFEIDAEGMVPEDELIIVENGFLKNLLNNRSITNTVQQANGFANGPGVLDITYETESDEKLLKKRLLEEAKKEGLSYALIIRDVGDYGLTDVYKVWVEDGREELYRNAVANISGFKILKNILDASQKKQVINLGGSGFGQFGRGNFVISYVVPEVLLFRDVEVQAVPIPSPKEIDYVKSPL